MDQTGVRESQAGLDWDGGEARSTDEGQVGNSGWREGA